MITYLLTGGYTGLGQYLVEKLGADQLSRRDGFDIKDADAIIKLQ